MSKLTEEDVRMIVYFHVEKGDVTRWVPWDERRSQVEAEFPELIKALDDFRIAERTIDAVLERMQRIYEC